MGENPDIGPFKALVAELPKEDQEKIREMARAGVRTIVNNTGRSRPPLRLQDGTLRPRSMGAPSATEQLIVVLNTIFDYAYDSALKDGETDAQAAKTAINAWRSSLPTIDSRASICRYVACVAAGAQRGWLRPEETKTLLYATQMALAALPRD